jgi:hypothetical protein
LLATTPPDVPPPQDIGWVPWLFASIVSGLIGIIYYQFKIMQQAERRHRAELKEERIERKRDQRRNDRERPERWAEANARAYTHHLDEREKRRGGK